MTLALREVIVRQHLPCWRDVALALALALACAAATAQAPARTNPVQSIAADGPAWAALSPAERAALAPLQSEWGRIAEAQKIKWIDLARKMPAMPATERERIQVRMAEWTRMTPAERGRARLQFQESRRITPSDKQERWQAYQALPPEQRQALAAKANRPAVAPASRTVRAGERADAPVERKRNTVPYLPPTVAPKAVGPTIVQSRPGATTQLVTQPPVSPLHQQAGMPKIPATRGFVDPETLLPKRGPQGAAVAAPPASLPSASSATP